MPSPFLPVQEENTVNSNNSVPPPGATNNNTNNNTANNTNTIIRPIKKYPTAADISYVGRLDIKGEYPWTLSNNVTLRNYVPGVVLTEYQLTRNGEIQALINSVLSVAESDFAAGLGGAALGGTFLNAVRPFLNSTGTVGRVLLSPLGGALARAGGAGAALAARSAMLKDDILAPYRGLYPAVATGNQYVLPYLSVDNMTEAGGSWRAIDETSLTNKIGTVVGGITGSTGDASDAADAAARKASSAYKALKTISQLELALTQPGVAQEKIKAFTPNDTGDSINVSFYLYNTTDNLDFLYENWAFLWHLTYQNLPNRKSINAIDPPCVYEVEVPGFKRFPIAVIESFKVTNEGTTRMVDVRNGNIANFRGSTVKLIPEAYKVTLKITSLLGNTRNLHYYMYNQIDNRINVFSEENTSKPINRAEAAAQARAGIPPPSGPGPGPETRAGAAAAARAGIPAPSGLGPGPNTRAGAAAAARGGTGRAGSAPGP